MDRPVGAEGTPKTILDKLEATMRKAFADPAVRAKLEASGFVVVASSSADCTQFVQEEIERWSKVVQTSGIKAE